MDEVCTPSKFSKTMDGGPMTMAYISDTGNSSNMLSSESVERFCKFLGPTFYIYSPEIPEEGLELRMATTTVTIKDPNFKMISNDGWNGKCLYIGFTSTSTSSAPIYFGVYDTISGTSESTNAGVTSTNMSNTNCTVTGINNGKAISISLTLGTQIIISLDGKIPILFKAPHNTSVAYLFMNNSIGRCFVATNTINILLRPSKSFIFLPAFIADTDYDYSLYGVYHVLAISHNSTDSLVVYNGHIYNTCCNGSNQAGCIYYLDVTGLED